LDGRAFEPVTEKKELKMAEIIVYLALAGAAVYGISRLLKSWYKR
jgi:hypothetical protein